jgi:hypothetical protein
MRLLDLSPRFLKRTGDSWQQDVERPGDSDGLIFLCPKCFEQNKGPVGTHSIICWRPHVPPDIDPKPGRWEMKGAGFADLTLVAGSSSVNLTGSCNAHFFVTNGEIRMVA